MALPRGQVDRFGNPIPANQSVKVWINSDGTVPQQRETVKLDPTITATDDPATQATVLSVSGAPAAGITSLTTDIVATGPGASVATIQAGVVDNSKLATMGANTIKANVTGTTAAPADVAISGGAAGSAIVPLVIGQSNLSAAASYTSPTWTAGKYRKITIEFDGLTNGYVQFQANADATSVYSDVGANTNGAGVTPDAAPKGTNGFARIAVTLTTGTSMSLEASFSPLTTGRERVGTARATAIPPAGTNALNEMRTTGFCWHNTATDVTFVTISCTSGQTMTGTIRISGILA